MKLDRVYRALGQWFIVAGQRKMTSQHSKQIEVMSGITSRLISESLPATDLSVLVSEEDTTLIMMYQDCLGLGLALTSDQPLPHKQLAGFIMASRLMITAANHSDGHSQFNAELAANSLESGMIDNLDYGLYTSDCIEIVKLLIEEMN